MPEVTHEHLAQIYEKFNDMGRQLTKVDTVVSRFDAAFDKLTEVSQTVSKILAVQENRLETQERIGGDLQRAMEERRKEVDEQIRYLENIISKQEKEIDGNLAFIKKELLTHFADMKKRITKIERWVYMVTGGGVLAGFIIGTLIKFI